MEDFIEIMERIKEKCNSTNCEACPFSVGIYQEGPGFTYYFCDIRKKPRDWDLVKKRVKQDKNYKKNLEKEEKKKLKEKEKKPKKRGRKKKEEKTS